MQMPATGGPTGAGVRIAIIDSGVDAEHPDLKHAIDDVQSANCMATASAFDDLADTHSHGTHLSGIIAASGELSGGRYRGLAPEATLVIMKICHSGRDILRPVINKAIRTAIKADVDILFLGSTFSPLEAGGRAVVPPPWVWAPSQIQERLREATDAGILCVVPAGNDGIRGLGTVHSEGGDDGVLCVGACDGNGKVRADSGCGPLRTNPTGNLNHWYHYDPSDVRKWTQRAKPDLLAPGDGIWATLTTSNTKLLRKLRADPRSFNGAYRVDGGTSQAAAVVTGLAACALELLRSGGRPLGSNPGMVLRRILCDAAQPSPMKEAPAECCGAGIPRWPSLVKTIQRFRHNSAYAAEVLRG